CPRSRLSWLSVADAARSLVLRISLPVKNSLELHHFRAGWEYPPPRTNPRSPRRHPDSAQSDALLTADRQSPTASASIRPPKRRSRFRPLVEFPAAAEAV